MLNNGSSSLGNTNELFEKLLRFNQDTLPLKHINKLINDLTKLLYESDFYDTEIRVGRSENIKTFKAHSNILKARSLYFMTALSDNWAKKFDGIILFEKENISPKIFEVFLF